MIEHDYGFSDELKMVQETVRRFVREQLRPVEETLDPDAIEFHEALERGYARLEKESIRAVTPRRRRPREAPSPLKVQGEAFRRRHGGRLEMRFSCHHCDGPISEAMRVCPWCVSGDNSFSDISAYPLVCPDCERGVRAEWSACPWCSKGRLQANGRRPRVDAKAGRSCSRKGCSGELRSWMKYCPLCKQKTKRVWTDDELGGRCPRCRWSVSKEFWHFCPWCGRRQAGAGRVYARSR